MRRESRLKMDVVDRSKFRRIGDDEKNDFREPSRSFPSADNYNGDLRNRCYFQIERSLLFPGEGSSTQYCVPLMKTNIQQVSLVAAVSVQMLGRQYGCR